MACRQLTRLDAYGTGNIFINRVGHTMEYQDTYLTNSIENHPQNPGSDQFLKEHNTHVREST